MATYIGGLDGRFDAWQVYKDTSDIERTTATAGDVMPILGIKGGILLVLGTVITTNSIADGGTLNVFRKTSIDYVSFYHDVFLDLQTGQYLYAKINTSTYDVSLEYNSSPPESLSMTPSGFQRYPLAYINENGNVVDLRAIVIASGGSTTTVGPFDIIFNSAGATPFINVFPGTINGYVPSNILDTFYLSSPISYFIKLRCLTDGFNVTSSSIIVDGSPSAGISISQSAAPTTFDILIGIVTSDLTTYQTWTGNNIQASLTQSALSDKSTPATPGLSPYIRWYTWNITSTS